MFILRLANRTIEQRIEAVEEVLKKFPNATRQKITDWTNISISTLNKMEAEGHIKLPPKQKMTSKKTPWMKHLGKLSG